MIRIHKNTLEDLEFNVVLKQTAAFAITDLGRKKILELLPYEQENNIIVALKETHEFLASFHNENRIPNHGFEDINQALDLLSIENNYLDIESFRNIAQLSETVNTHLKFFKKFKEYYPILFLKSDELEPNKEISEAVHAVIDKFGEVKNNSSSELAVLRRAIGQVKSQLNGSFNKALQHYKNLDYLDEIKESVVENKRVLAVKAMYRRKVRGPLLGSSKTGSIVYIEPENTQQLQRELDNLEFEEREEIIKILKELTNTIRVYKPLLIEYLAFLVDIDSIYAKAKYAEDINAVLPKINKKKSLFLRDAFHPLLYLSNKQAGEVTYPQSIKMHSNQRIIVISGPNAGGKSITLKTVGLLQIMLQSGMLVPVHERSEFCLFENILSDIGDNQSIENHLSTYSYRLKQMNYFIRKCTSNTLFLIDEFGTGSDPELGGALAEAFLEEFYEREAFGIITTHYANLKLLANEKPCMNNASMLFNQKSLKPTFKLALGQAGSSFTFEVAQKNGIPYSLINKAKKKIERGKVRFDKTIAKLQRERAKLERTEQSLKINEQKKSEEAEKLGAINDRVQKKLESYQELYDSNQRMIYLGNKVNSLAEKYLNDQRKRELLNELFKLVQIENAKRKKTSANNRKVEKQKKERLKKEVDQKVSAIRKKKKAQKQVPKSPEKPKVILKVGDSVRLEDGRAVGTIDKIEKNKAVVNYGLFTTTVSLDQLEFVKKAK